MSETKRRLEAAQKETREVARTGKALVVVAHGKPYVLAWQAGKHLAEVMAGHGADKDGFDPEKNGYDMGPAPNGDGVYVCDLGWVDDGPGDWPGSREVLPSIKTWRPVTAEEWGYQRNGEWPWYPEEGWT